MARDDQCVIGRKQPVMGENGFLLPQCGSRVKALCPDHCHISLGHGQIGAGHILVALRFLGALDRRDITLYQPLLTAVRRFALGQNGTGAHHGCGGLGNIGLIGRHRCVRAGNARFLLGGVKDGQFLPLGHAVPGIGGQRGQGSAHLEADTAEYPRLDGAEPVDAKVHIMFGLNDHHRQRAFGEEQKAGSDSRRQKKTRQPNAPHRLFSFRSQKPALCVEQAQPLGSQVEIAGAERPADRHALHERRQ